MSRVKPNILIIVTDQEYAHPQMPEGYRLPNHERLKARGVTFDNFQSTTTLCTPSRACLYTGQHTQHNGMVDNTNLSFVGAMSTEIPTMGDMLREQGYDTAYKGKWHLARFSYKQTSVDDLEPYGFSDFQKTGDTHGVVEEGAARDAQIASDAAQWLQGRSTQDNPFLLAVNFINPHDIMFYHAGEGHKPGRMSVGSEPDSDLYRQRWNVSLPPSFFDDDAQHPEAIKFYRQTSNMMYGNISIERQDTWKKHINYYLNCLSDVDQQLGNLLDALEASDHADNTIILYTSDHGELAGAHRLAQKGAVLFRELVNVPMIIAHPDGAQGETTQAVGSLVDLIPTMLRWAGCEDVAERYPQLIGHDLSPIVIDPTNAGARGNSAERGIGALYTFDNIVNYDSRWFRPLIPHLLEIDGTGERLGPPENYIRTIGEVFEKYGKPNTENQTMIRGIFDGRYKLLRYFAIDNYHQPETVTALFANNDVALYDLVNDPHEMVNLARPDHPDYDEALLAEMNEKLNWLLSAEIGEDACPYGL